MASINRPATRATIPSWFPYTFCHRVRWFFRHHWRLSRRRRGPSMIDWLAFGSPRLYLKCMKISSLSRSRNKYGRNAALCKAMELIATSRARDRKVWQISSVYDSTLTIFFRRKYARQGALLEWPSRAKSIKRMQQSNWCTYTATKYDWNFTPHQIPQPSCAI